VIHFLVQMVMTTKTGDDGWVFQNLRRVKMDADDLENWEQEGKVSFRVINYADTYGRGPCSILPS
jgi:hypothetical protein